MDVVKFSTWLLAIAAGFDCLLSLLAGIVRWDNPRLDWDAFTRVAGEPTDPVRWPTELVIIDADNLDDL